MLCCVVPMAAARMQKHSGGIQRSQIKLSCSLICHCWLQADQAAHTHTYKQNKTIQQKSQANNKTNSHEELHAGYIYMIFIYMFYIFIMQLKCAEQT